MLRKIEKGVYLTGGNNQSQFGKNSVHNVNVPNDYYIGVFPVTIAQYERIFDRTSSDKHPQTGIAWLTMRNSAGINASLTPNKNDTEHVLVCLQGRAGIALDLPTQEMWEIAAWGRTPEFYANGGKNTYYFWGNDVNGDYCWYNGNSGGATHDVGTRLPNDLGIYDISGNVFESHLDIGQADDIDIGTRGVDAFTPHADGGNYNSRSCRGGSWSFPVEQCSPAWRQNFAANGSGAHMGFRVAYIAR